MNFNNVKLTSWIESFRFKTLPLAASSVLIASAISFWKGSFKPSVASLAFLTAILLQIISNLANDYGDSIKGSDTKDRLGPQRGMQKGIITQLEMKYAIIFFTIITILTGSALVFISFQNPFYISLYLMLGFFSIVAAIKYTVGKRPYGYLGFGDISVLFFFGWVGVLGTEYLQTMNFDNSILLPATAYGLLSVAVLNINNLRDIDSDKAHGKNTLAVRLGAKNARYYHVALLVSSIALLLLFTIFYNNSFLGYTFMLSIPSLFFHGRYVLSHSDPKDMRKMLKNMVQNAVFVSTLFSIGLFFS